jgi:hypothetical protein
MKPQTVIFAGVAAAIAGIAIASTRRPGAPASLVPAPSAANETWRTTGNGMPAGYSDDTKRLAGVQTMYNANAGQTAAVDAAIQQNWNDLQKNVFATSPDFWM